MSDWEYFWAARGVGPLNGTNARPDYYDVVGAAEFLHSNIGDSHDGGSLIDVGCGNGNLLFELKKWYPSLTGIDYSPKMIDWCKESLSNIANFYVGDAFSIPFKNESFNIAISMGVIQYCENDEKAKKMVDEMYRVVKPGGVVVVGDVLDRAEYEPLDGMGSFYPEVLANGRPYETVKSFYEADRRYDFILRKK
ncbi:MAG: Ubiquinone/menaquinone biosynthesis C-methyltransferase UbiE [Elusimicrobia bacterium]|nr:Ubiquinone/menaquinone biosynthesis C-methyltransferase UbiE [Elusimicrobiota bacterium]